jgi:hypothetical protein
VPIRKDCWHTFLLLALHLQFIEPSNLNQFLKILLSYRAFWDKGTYESVRETFQSIIEKHVVLNHSFEVSWSLWILISLNLKCQSRMVNAILDSQDSISKLVCLDLIDRNLYTGIRPKTSHIFRTFIQDDLYGESWLYVYESVFKGWLARSNPAFLKVDPFIKILFSSNVEFYSTLNQIAPEFIFDPDSKGPIKPIVTSKKKLTNEQKLALLFAASSPSKY